MNNRLKQIIFDKLYQDLRHVEIIPYGNSLWFIDSKEKCWYLEYKTRGVLLWRWGFFPRFFNLFSMEINEYEPLISEWVEEVLNCRVETSGFGYNNRIIRVEEVLNYKIKLTYPLEYHVHQVEKVLNDKDDQNE